ncbi:MAG: hypothetical protein ABUS51_03090, partial [Acidobacteriota bacterium]
GGKPPIMTAPYFVPIVMWLVGFTVSLSAFYTVRIGQSGDVRITYSPQNAVLALGMRHLGLLPDTVVRFAGAANSPADVTVSWDFHLEEPCGPPVGPAKPVEKGAFEKEMVSAFDSATGRLTTPPQAVLQDWINRCPGAQNWILTATSNQDRDKSSSYNVKFCRTKQDCPVTTGASPAPAAAGRTDTGEATGTSSGTGSGPASAGTPENHKANGDKAANGSK